MRLPKANPTSTGLRIHLGICTPWFHGDKSLSQAYGMFLFAVFVAR